MARSYIKAAYLGLSEIVVLSIYMYDLYLVVWAVTGLYNNCELLTLYSCFVLLLWFISLI